jgi:hypothetical protein
MPATVNRNFHIFLENLLLIVAASILAFACLMGTKIIPYFSFNPLHGFLGTKTDAVLDKPLFQVSFYIHIASSWFAMTTGALQLIPALYRRLPLLHRWLGLVYVLVILVLACPSGLGLAIYANGGLAARVGFTFQCIVWWLFTWQAWQYARQKQWEKHANAMLRSLAVTTAAMSLRTESYILFYYLGTKPIETYLTVTWLSWVGNLFVADVLIYLGWAAFMLKSMFGSENFKTPT